MAFTIVILHTLANEMTWPFYTVLFISLGITVGLFFAYQGYKYFLSSAKKTQVYIPRIVLHSLEQSNAKGQVLFHFELRANQAVIFEICNEAFESVKVLFTGELTEGAHTQSFNTTELPNGTYFYRLKGASQEVMKKFAIVN